MQKYFETEKINDVIFVKLLFSEMSMEEAEDFKQQFYKLISESNNRFVIDLSRCAFLPSVVLGVIINFTAKVHQTSGKIAFCSASEWVRSIFKVTHLEKIFAVYETREKALEAFK